MAGATQELSERELDDIFMVTKPGNFVNYYSKRDGAMKLFEVFDSKPVGRYPIDDNRVKNQETNMAHLDYLDFSTMGQVSSISNLYKR